MQSPHQARDARALAVDMAMARAEEQKRGLEDILYELGAALSNKDMMCRA